MIPVNRPLITREDLDAVQRCLDEGWISGEGPFVSSFEEELASAHSVDAAIAVSSGTAACDVLNDFAELQPGDEVIVPATTIISTISNAARRGATIRCVDVSPDSWCASPDDYLNVINPRTRVAWIVHLFGLAVDLDPILDTCRDHGALVFEDAAEAIGVTYKGRLVGSIADAGVLSFYANKTVTCGEGGAILTSKSDIDARVRSLRNLCFDPAERFVHHDLGYNFRMPSLSAALARSQLSRLDDLLSRKREIGDRYNNGLAGHPWLQLPKRATAASENAYWVYGIVLHDDAPFDAKSLRDHLRSRGIDSRRFFYPINHQPVLRRLGLVSDAPMPVAERLWKRGIYIPSGLGTSDDEVDRTIEELWSACR